MGHPSQDVEALLVNRKWCPPRRFPRHVLFAGHVDGGERPHRAAHQAEKSARVRTAPSMTGVLARQGPDLL
jgi:hypothetical protein